MSMPQPGYGGPRLRLPKGRFRRIPVRTLVPNVITLLALCAGLTAIRMAFENRYVLALAAIVFAAFLDGIDGRLARFLKGTSRFGAELDSLADFVNFGVAPALILYFWGLHDLKSAGWIAAMEFAICAALRLARFNVMADDPAQPVLAHNFLLRVPAPARPLTVLLSIALACLGALAVGIPAPPPLRAAFARGQGGGAARRCSAVRRRDGEHRPGRRQRRSPIAPQLSRIVSACERRRETKHACCAPHLPGFHHCVGGGSCGHARRRRRAAAIHHEAASCVLFRVERARPGAW